MNVQPRHREELPEADTGEVEDRVPRRPEPYPAEKARQGSIMLDTPWKRGVFAGALAGAVILAIVVLFAA